MNADICGFSHEELCVMLDALYYYIEGIAYEIANKKKSIEEIDARCLPTPFN